MAWKNRLPEVARATAAIAFAIAFASPAITAEEMAPGPVLKSISPEQSLIPMVSVSIAKLCEIEANLKTLRLSVDALQKQVKAQATSKESISISLSSIRPLIATMKKNSEHFTTGKEGFECTNEIRVAIQPDLEIWRDSVNEASDEMDSIERLVSAPSWSNIALAADISSLRESIKTIEKARRRVYEVVRHTPDGYR